MEISNMKFICIFFIISAACFSCDEAPQTEKKLIAKDVIDAQGEIKKMKDFEVKRKAEEVKK